jgi:hydrogenase expression/formation protein HypC
MCLAVPGKVIQWRQREPPFASALVEFGGVQRSVNMSCTTDVELGDYVLVHAGIAINRIDPDEAAKVWATLEQIDLDEMGISHGGDTVVDEE